MPQTERFTQVLNLASLDVFIETEINDDSYFQINGLPETLGFGKHAFSITYKDPAGQPRLKENTTITFEFVDSNGITVFSELADYEDVSGGATAYVWIKEDPLRTADSIADGPLSLYIVGTLDGVPEEFADKKNLRSTFRFEVRKNFPNLSPIIFYDVDSLLTGANFSESIELDQNDGVYTRSYLTVSSSHLQTQGGRVAFGELSYRETGSRADDFKVISQFPLEGTTAVFETDSDGQEGVSPLSHLLKIPTPTEFRRDTPVYFRLKFLDENKTPAQYRDNNRLNTDIEITSSVIDIEGSPFFIEKEDNLLKGSMFTGNAVGKGFEQSGKSSAFLKTVDYEGFLSASSGQGSPGVMFFSGSVLTSSGDEYTGVGLELHGGQNSSSFRFRSNPSLLEVKANTFFVGTEDTQFISGSGNNIEISSSGFHLTAEGDITASKFKMEGGVITGDVSILADLTANTIRTPAEIAGNPSTTFNASSSIDSSGFAIFKSASIGGFLVDETEIKSAQDDPFLRIKSNGQISGSAILLASNSFDVNFETLERFGGDNFQSFFMADNTGIRMQTSNFNLNAQRFIISSSDVGVMAVGATPPVDFNDGTGFYVDGDGNLLIGKSDGPRIQFDGFNTIISSSNFFLGGGGQFVSGSLGNIEISSSNFHLTNAGDVTMQGTVTATAGAIGGFIIDSDEIKSSDDKIALNSANKSFHIDDSTFGNAGVQLQYKDDINLGRFHVGDGSSNFLKFDGTTLDIQTDAFFIGRDDTQFISGSVNSIEISSSLFHLNPRTNTLALSGSITATGGTIGGFIIEADRLVNTANTVELSTTTPGLNIKDALGVDRVTIKSGSFLEIGAGTQYIQNRGFELTGSISAGRNLNPSILSWSYSMGGRATASLTDRAAFVDLHKAVSGDITLDVIVPSGTQNYTGHNNTYEIVQVITSSFTAGDTLSFAAVARFSSSFGEGKERALQPQYFRLEYSSSDSNGFKPFLPSANFTASNGYGQYFLGTGQYNSFGASAELPAAASFIKVILTGSINDDSGYDFEKPLFAKATMGNFKNDSELSAKTFTKSFVNTENPEFPETEITFDNFRLRSNTRKVEMTQEGLLIYNSEDSFFKMSADGIEIQGGSGVSAFGNSINREVLTNDSQVAGTLGAPALQPYTSDPENVSTTAFQGNIGEFARGNHRHALPFATVNSVVEGENFTSLSASSVQFTELGSVNKANITQLTSSNIQITGDVTGSSTSVLDFGVVTASKGLITDLSSPSATITNLTSTFGTFGGITVEGDVTAQRYIVSSSVTHMTTSFSSGSTIFGDDIDDTHKFTGSLQLSGALSITDDTLVTNLNADKLDNQEGSFYLDFSNFVVDNDEIPISKLASDAITIGGAGSTTLGGTATVANILKGSTAVSSSAQIATDISGSFVAPSASISTRLTNLVTDSGSFSTRVTNLVTDSASFSTRITTEEGNVDTLQSRNLTAGTGLTGGGDLTSDRTFAIDFEDSTFKSTVSGSLGSNADLIRTLTATTVSGSFTEASGGFSTRLTTAETELENRIVSASAQISSEISGSFIAPSASISTRLTTEESNVDTLQSRNLTAGTGLTGGGDLTSDRTFAIDFEDTTFKSAVSGAFQGAISDGTLTSFSGSSTSTGSFGSVHTLGQTGIQTTAPKKGLTVKATGNDDGIALLASNGQYVALIHQQDSDAGMLRLYDESSTTKIAFNADDGETSYFNNGGKVGIGTTGPDTELHIHQGSAGFTDTHANYILTLEGSSDVIMQFKTPNNRDTVGIVFGDPDDRDAGRVIYDHTTDRLNLFAAGTQQLQIGSNIISGSSTSTGSFGAVGIGNNFTPLGGEKLNVSGDIVLGNSSDARIRYSDGVSRAHIAPDQNVEIRFGFANTSDKIFYHSTTEVAKINSSGITVSSGNVSGSSSSTGSFGKLALDSGTITTTGDITLDSGGDIILDADGTDIILKDGGTSFGSFKRVSSDFVIKSEAQDKDIVFKGNDGGGTITTMTIDMSEGGKVGIGTSSPSELLHVAGDAKIDGTITAQEFHTEFVSASIQFTSGSTKFGDTMDDIHNFTGSLIVSGAANSLISLGDVGIGTTSPARKLEIKDTSSNVGIRLTTGTALDAIIDLGDTGDADIGQIRYDNNTDKMHFRTNASDRLTIDSSGKVGIGTSSPASLLHIGDATTDTSVDSTTYLKIAKSGTVRMQLNSTNSGVAALHFGDTGDVDIGSIEYTNSSNQFDIYTNASHAITIDSSQRVGIGVSNPTQRLHVSQSSGTSALIDGDGNGNNPILHVRDRADTFVSLFEGNRIGDTGAAIAIYHNPATSQETNRTRLNFQMNDDGDNRTTYAQLASFIDDHTDGTEDGNLRISTVENGTLTEQMRINSTGVGIGETSPDQKLHITAPTQMRLERASVASYDTLIDNLVHTDTADLTFQAQTSDTGFLFQSKHSNGTQINALAINNIGRIGIGNTNPSSSLHIGNELTNTNGSLTIAGYNSNIRTLFEPGTDTFHFKMFSPSSVSVMSLHKDGNVRIENGNLGIGTASPNAKLEVIGDISGSSTSTGSFGTLNLGDSSHIHTLSIKGQSEGSTGIRVRHPSDDTLFEVIASEDDGRLRLFANNSRKIQLHANDVSYFNGGNVGIGTESPNRLLTLVGSTAAMNIDSAGNAFITIDRGAVNDVGQIEFKTAGSAKWYAGMGDSGNFGDGTEFFIGEGSGGASDIHFLIDASGNIGIGTSSPDTLLHLKSTSASKPVLTIENEQGGANPTALRFKRVTSSPANDDQIGQIEFRINNDADEDTLYSHIQSVATNVADGSESGKLDFFTMKSGTSTRTLTMSAGQVTVTDHFSLPATKAIFLDGGSNTFIRESSSDNIEFATNNTARLNIGNTTSAFTNDVTIADGESLGTTSFTSGFVGAGFRIDQGITETGKTTMTVDNMTVRGTMSIFELMIQQVRATNGNLYITSTGKVDSVTDNGSGNFTLNFDTGEGSGHGFAAGDVIRMQRFDNSGGGASVTISDLTVASVANTGSISADLRSGTTPPSGGFEYVRLGNTSTGSRQGGIYLTADDSNAPFIDVFDNITSHADWNSNTGSANSNSGASGTKVRMGRLDGITSARFGTLSNQYGLFASGSVFLEGTINAKAGNIGGWGIGETAISSSGDKISIDAGINRITINDGSNDRIFLGEVDGNGSVLPGTEKYGLKIFQDTGTTDADRLVELGEGGNIIAGWDIMPGAIKSDNAEGSVALSANSQSLMIFTGSIDNARPKVVVGKLPRVGGSASDDRYGFGVFTGTVDADITDDKTYNVLITRDKAKLAGWDLVPGNIQSDNSFGSVRLSSISQSLTIWTGSVNEAQPKLVLGKLPLNDGTVDSPYGFAVFSGEGTVSGSEASASVLITANKARLAGWELVPGRLKSGTVADINGNQGSIALGNGATSAGGTPTDGLFFVSASTQPVFYVGANFSYVNDVLTAGGWKIGNGIISSSVSDDTDGVIIDSQAKVLTFHGANGKDSFQVGGRTRNNVRLAVGQVATGSYGIKGFNSSGDRVFEVSETRNEIGGFTINPNSLIGATSGTEKFRVELGTGDGLLIDDAVSFGLSLGGDASSDYDAATATSIPIVMAHDGSGGRTIFRVGDTTNFLKFDSAGTFTIQNSGTTTISGSAVNIQTPKFFLGSGQPGQSGQFVSGSNGNIEISSSNFHLSSSGDVVVAGNITATTGEIGGWTIGTDNINYNDGTERIRIDANSANLQIDGDDAAGILMGTNVGGSVTLDTNTSIPIILGTRDDGSRSVFRVGSASAFMKFDTNVGFQVSSSNFHLDTSGNVTLSGTVTADAGNIGGLILGTNQLQSSANPKRGIKLNPGEKISGNGNSAHSFKTNPGGFSFTQGSIGPSATSIVNNTLTAARAGQIVLTQPPASGL